MRTCTDCLQHHAGYTVRLPQRRGDDAGVEMVTFGGLHCILNHLQHRAVFQAPSEGSVDQAVEFPADGVERGFHRSADSVLHVMAVVFHLPIHLNLV